MLLLGLRVGGSGWGVGVGGGAACNRLVTSIGELTLGPCQLSPGGDVFSAWDLGWVRVIVARGISRRS